MNCKITPKPKIIAIIPARGGSKGVPQKNIRNLAEKPLIAYSIEAGTASKYIDMVAVSTEDQEITTISEKYGAEVVKRPDSLAQDDSPTIDAVFHVIESLNIQNEKLTIVVLLQPTSPLRNSQDIDSAIKLFLINDCDSVISVSEYQHSPYWAYKIDDKYLKPLFDNNYLKMRRQDLPKSYMPNGAIYISTVGFLQECKSFNSSRTLPYMMPAIRSVDIDTEFDFILAESIITMSNK
ncbi:MAG: acylneuraminate cytidylyltransferase family protein [Methanosarcina vacuolata]|jgi:CMP-N-acetylneuraminic acid synthetase|nr:acylneuraminate cytidylyltransferase family protein [Methanosarcina vacuolata]